MNLETLERRRLLSVSVVEGYPGYYEVYGDDSADVIDISVSAADSTFTLNGATYGGVSYISIFAYEGDDSVSVVIDGETPIGASINTGPGNDDVTLVGGGAVWGEGGNDTIRVADSFRGEAYGGPGDDKIVISGACADAEISGGPGNDWIDASASTYGLFLHGDQGDDFIFGSGGDDAIYGDNGSDLLIGSGGNDVFPSKDGERDRIVGGAGIDIAWVDLEDGVWGVEYVFYV
jgi:Ca2+-binding RTX toxin-like protein